MKSSSYLGRRGEQAAASYLLTCGWKILHRNFRLGKKEIDLIATKNDNLALFEIKTRSEQKTDYPISAEQRAILRKVHLEYCELNSLNPSAVAYNLLLINYFNGQADLEYYADFL